MLEIWWIRHGETDWNTENRIQGSADQPLNARGLHQAALLAPRLATVGFDAVYASDLDRARTTAHTALPDADVRLDRRLRELAYGVLEGKIWAQLGADDADLAAHWSQDRLGRRLPGGGESYGDLMARVAAFQADLPTHGRVAAFSHGGTIRSALYGVIGLPAQQAWRVEIDNTSVTRLRFDDRGATLLSVNDRAHLERV